MAYSSARTIKVQQQPSTEGDPCRICFKQVIDSAKFDALMGLVILANAITIGVEQSLRLEGNSSIAVQILEHLFLLTYIGEIAVRVYVQGISCFKANWVKFDAFLTSTGVVQAWIIDPIFGSVQSLKLLLFLRMLRLLRLARVLRLLLEMRELYTLMRAIRNSVATVSYTLGFLFISIYIFGCVGVELITNHDRASSPEFQPSVERYFKNLPMTMFTLIRFACLDDMSSAYDDLVAADWTLAIYFISVILIVGIVFMNLLSAAVINSSLEQSSLDREALKQVEEKRRRALLQELKRLFTRIDADGSGTISLREIQSMEQQDKALLSSAMGTSDMAAIFKQLDFDSGGSVDIDEFVDGMEVALSAAPIELKRLEGKVNLALGRLKHQEEYQKDMTDKWGAAISELQASLQDLQAMNARQSEKLKARSDIDLSRENAALKGQLQEADAALLDVLQKTRKERLKAPPAKALGG